MSAARSVLPASLAPRGLSREIAAEYVGVSPRTFDEMVDTGVMPKPLRYGRRTIWDRLAVDAAFASLPRTGEGEPDDEGPNPWLDVGLIGDRDERTSSGAKARRPRR